MVSTLADLIPGQSPFGDPVAYALPDTVIALLRIDARSILI